LFVQDRSSLLHRVDKRRLAGRVERVQPRSASAGSRAIYCIARKAQVRK
jgi:hypothetical protein